ncbi:MAG: RsmE family RNA methyltransferase [Candidatus Susulua stagnicola]|nr:RsmE family RNA methyltransferase [Candidatus Susulua stagnicola]
MPKIRIYIEPKDINNFIEVKDLNIVHKIKNVLRLRKEDILYIFDGQGKEYLSQIEIIAKKSIIIKIDKLFADGVILNKKITLGFPLVKESKISFILQKATELGVNHFIPFVSERSLRGQISDNKIEKWKKIIIEAVRQSERLWIPTISKVLNFKEIIKSNNRVKLVTSVNGKKINTILNGKEEDVFVVVGPEGGFSSLENDQLKNNNFKFFNLSSHILRVETASLFSVGLINYFI